VDREVERRKPPERLRVVGVTPEHRAHAAAVEQRAESAVDVRSGRLLFDEHRAGRGDGSFAVGVTTLCSRRAELSEENVGPAAQPSRQPSEERQDPLVGGAIRPRRVTRISVHRQKVADLGGLARAEVSVLLEVFHVEPQRDERVGVGAADGVRHSQKPLTGAGLVGGDYAVRVFVSEVQRPQRSVPRERTRDLTRERRLRADNRCVGVPAREA
jgi:hypothetical protein